jgi:hypothetical protein
MGKRTFIHTFAGVYPVLDIVMEDGRRARLGYDNNRSILERWGLIYLGTEFEGDEKYLHRIPADPEGGRAEMLLEGFTDDQEIIRVYLEWLGNG